MTSKQLPTLGVLGVATGIVLKRGGFDEIQEVMDHLYPGIMTIGCAMMAKTAAKFINSQHPEFAALPNIELLGWQEYAKAGLDRFGPTISVEGPHGTGNPDMGAE